MGLGRAPASPHRRAQTKFATYTVVPALNAALIMLCGFLALFLGALLYDLARSRYAGPRLRALAFWMLRLRRVRPLWVHRLLDRRSGPRPTNGAKPEGQDLAEVEAGDLALSPFARALIGGRQSVGGRVGQGS